MYAYKKIDFCVPKCETKINSSRDLLSEIELQISRVNSIYTSNQTDNSQDDDLGKAIEDLDNLIGELPEDGFAQIEDTSFICTLLDIFTRTGSQTLKLCTANCIETISYAYNCLQSLLTDQNFASFLESLENMEICRIPIQKTIINMIYDGGSILDAFPPEFWVHHLSYFDTSESQLCLLSALSTYQIPFVCLCDVFECVFIGFESNSDCDDILSNALYVLCSNIERADSPQQISLIQGCFTNERLSLILAFLFRPKLTRLSTRCLKDILSCNLDNGFLLSEHAIRSFLGKFMSLTDSDLQALCLDYLSVVLGRKNISDPSELFDFIVKTTTNGTLAQKIGAFKSAEALLDYDEPPPQLLSDEFFQSLVDNLDISDLSILPSIIRCISSLLFGRKHGKINQIVADENLFETIMHKLEAILTSGEADQLLFDSVNSLYTLMNRESRNAERD